MVFGAAGTAMPTGPGPAPGGQGGLWSMPHNGQAVRALSVRASPRGPGLGCVRLWMPEPVRTSITSGPPQDAIGDEVRQALGNPAVGVEPRVEDRDLQAACAITGEQAAEDLCGLLPGNAAGMAVVHGWHQGVIELFVHRLIHRPVEVFGQNVHDDAAFALSISRLTGFAVQENCPMQDEHETGVD